jgi:hypothetical protein
MKNKVILVTIILVITVLIFSGCVDNNKNSNNTDNTGTWLDDYSPVHSIGTGSNDFWIEFPAGSENSGQIINHLSWIMDSIESNCVVFVVHKTGCVGCAAQAERVINLAGTYENLVEFYDLDIPLGGDIEQMAYDSYLYDPDGPPGYIALTGVYTFVKQDGETKVGWHSWEGNVADSDMEDWIKDAIYYHHINKGEV